MPTKVTLQEINDFDRERFTAVLGSLFEGSPWIAEQAWQARPFNSISELHKALCAVMYEASEERQLALIHAHPDLVGRAALAGTLTPESTTEQASAGLDNLSPQEIEQFNTWNKSYKEKFGFPFVICARQNKKESILAGFAARIHNSPQQEVEVALSEITKIAYLRLKDIAGED